MIVALALIGSFAVLVLLLSYLSRRSTTSGPRPQVSHWSTPAAGASVGGGSDDAGPGSGIHHGGPDYSPGHHAHGHQGHHGHGVDSHHSGGSSHGGFFDGGGFSGSGFDGGSSVDGGGTSSSG